MTWLMDGEPFSSSLSRITFTLTAGWPPPAFSASMAASSIMIGPLSSAEARPNTRHSGSSGPLKSGAASISSHSPLSVLRLSTGVHGLFCAHCAGITGWPSRCM
ncbi:hypothetical protein D3C71_841200 [compost metagenome]